MSTRKKALGRNRYEILEFPVEEVFPADNLLAIDLIRLQAAYNDIREIIDWMGAHQTNPKKPIATQKYRVRATIQHRILFALMHEALQIFDQLQSREEFKRASELLDPDGKQALTSLRLAQQGPDPLRQRLSNSRNKLIFHYDSEDFRIGLSKFSAVFSENGKPKSQMILQKNNWAYYLLPEDIRDIIIYKFESKIYARTVETNLGTFLTKVTDLQKELFDFLESLFIAYIKLKRIDHLFKLKIVEE